MKKHIIRFCTLFLLSASILSCKKDYDGLGPLEDSIADIPVTVTNAAYFERIPIVTASKANGTGPFSVIFQIPANKGKIKEITRVAVGTPAAGLSDLQGAMAINAYNYDSTTKQVVAIEGNGTNEITFTSSLNDYTAYRTLRGNPDAIAAATVAMTKATTTVPAKVDERNPTQLRYWFLLTLEDGTQIIATEVRVRILP